MSSLVDVARDGAVTTITMDDGKVNALSPQMLSELGAGLDAAEADGSVVVLTGRDGLLSGGFDLEVLRAGGPDAVGMLRGGFDLAARLLAFPRPVLIACPGHAIAMASFLLLSVDERIGVDGAATITANEVAIGLTMPFAAIALCRHRLSPAHFDRAVGTAAVYTPSEAVAAGFLDRAVPPADFDGAVREAADRLASLEPVAHAQTKLRVRSRVLAELRDGVEQEFGAV